MVLASSAFKFGIAVNVTTIKVFNKACMLAVFFRTLADIFGLN